MESYFDVMAQDPNCLLAVDAQDGGKWKSSFQLPHYINYAQNSKYWTNFNSFFNTDDGIKYTDDFEFEMEFYWNYTEEEMAALTENVHLFYNTFGSTPIGISVSNTTRKLSVFPSGSTVSSTAGGVASTSLVSKGKYTLKYIYKFSTGSVTLVLNGVEVSSVLPITNRTDFNVSRTNRSFFNGNIHYITLTKTTGGTRTLTWEANQFDLKSNLALAPTAPLGTGSFEETHGLLTKTNVEAENNYFKYITNDIGYIETPLDLRGYSGDFTMIAKALVAKNEVAGTTKKAVFLMQGNLDYTRGSFVFFILQMPNTSRYELNFYVQNSSNSMIMIKYTIPNNFDWTMPHVFAVNYVATTKIFSLFIDREVVVTSTQTTFDSFYNGTAAKTQIACKADGVEPDVMKQNNAMIFDKALSADEIKILSDSMTEKKVEYASDDLLCTTPVNLTSNTSDPDWECYTEPLATGTDVSSSTAYMAAAGYTGYALNTDGGRWAADKGTALTDTSAGVRFVWKRTDLEEWAVKRVNLGNQLKSVFPQRIHHFILQGSNDGTTWTNIGEKQTPTVTFNVYNEQTFDYLSNTEKYKYWAINCNYDLTWPDVSPSQVCAAANKIQFTNEI